MGLFIHILMAVGHLILVMIDITAFFLIIRLIYRRWPVKALSSFDAAGKPLVDELTRHVGDRWQRLDGSRTLSLLQELILTLALLTAVRLLLSGLLASIT